MNGLSLLPVAGWWVAWVYALSLALPFLLGPVPVPPPPRPFELWAREVIFKSPNLVVSAKDAAGLTELTAIATKPAPESGNIKVAWKEQTAKYGTDFQVADRGAEIHFEKGATEGKLRFLTNWGPDIRIVDDGQWNEPRSFRLSLQSGPDAVSAGDFAMCTITIDDGKQSLDPARIPVGFARAELPVPLKDAATLPIDVESASSVPQPVPIQFTLHHTVDGVRRPLKQFEKTLAQGEQRLQFRLADHLSRDELERFGLNDSGAAGYDETYEIDLMAPRPLFPDGRPSCRIIAENTNPPPIVEPILIDGKGDEVAHIDPDGKIKLRIDRPFMKPTEQLVSIGGREIGTVRFRPGETLSDSISLADKGLEDHLRRRIDVSSKPKPGGSGGCKGQQGCSNKALCGEPVPGDYMLIVVNNERLHDPNDGIVAEVRKALADESAKPYGNGAIILNPADEDELTPTGGGPDPKKMFQPFREAGHDVAGQLKRIEEVVARKREAAAKPDLRAVVVWPERDLATGAGVRPVAGPDLQPMSFLLPDAAASYARAVERGLVPPEAGAGDVTVRAPRERELEAHLVNVIGEGRATEGETAE